MLFMLFTTFYCYRVSLMFIRLRRGFHGLCCGIFLIFFCSDSKCSYCKKFRPFTSWDYHSLCPACRECSQEAPCQVCRGWSPAEWELIRQRSEERGKSIPKKKKTGHKKRTDSGSMVSRGEASETAVGTARPGPSVSSDGNYSCVQASEIGVCTASPGFPILTTNPSVPTSRAAPASTTSGSGAQASQDLLQSQGNFPVPSAPASAAAPSPGGASPAQDSESASGLDISFSSGLQTTVTRDFEGFSERSRSRHRSKSKSKKKRRHRSSSSSSSGDRRRRRKHHSHSDMPSEALSQLVAILSQAVSQAPGSIDANPSGPRGSTVPAPAPASSGVQPTSAQDPHFSGDQHDLDSLPDNVHLDSGQSVSEVSGDSEDDDPIMGTEVSKESFDRAVDVIRRQLGFDPPAQDSSSYSSSSKLTLNKPSKPTKSIMPVDAECFDRFEFQAKAKKWRAFPRKQSSEFRISDQDYKAFFSAPTIPVSCLDKLKEANAVDQKGKFRASATKTSFSSLQGIDLAARTGLKFASSLLLFAEILSRSFRQTGTEQISRKDTGAIVNLLGPISRLTYDQLAKIAVKASLDRRQLVLDNINWPSKDISRRFMELPLSGADLFGGKFDEQLATEIKRKKDINKADFSFSKPQPVSSKSRKSPRRQSGRRQPRFSGFQAHRSSAFGRGRPRNQASTRGFSGTSLSSFSNRRPVRGNDRTSSRGAGRFNRP